VSPIAEIRFLTVDGRRLAYEVAGEGSLLLCPAWWVSHLELDRGNEGFGRFWEAIGDGYSVVRYDRLGVGVSGRELREQDLSVDGEVAVIGALLDELGAERISLFGGSSGGCAAIAFAARFSERVERLVLYGSDADGPSISPPAVREAIVACGPFALGPRVAAFIGHLSRGLQALAHRRVGLGEHELVEVVRVVGEIQAGAAADPQRPSTRLRELEHLTLASRQHDRRRSPSGRSGSLSTVSTARTALTTLAASPAHGKWALPSSGTSLAP
jgi:pimeloyl-ACP methyl ester carboxylesterase